MKESPGIGMNRTGVALAPERTSEMIAGTREFPPSSAGTETDISGVRVSYARHAEPIGTLPPPASLKGFAKTAVKALQGKGPTLFIDKLGARLGFERTGTRVYQALLSKFDAFGTFTGGPQRGDLEHILEEEFAHAQLLTQALERIGADPTVLTPSADVESVASSGVVKVTSDPRMTFVQSLEAVLIAELADNDCWQALIELAQILGEDELAEQFSEALMHEREHLANVRTWLAAAQGRVDGHLADTGAGAAGSTSSARGRSGKLSARSSSSRRPH